MFWKISSFGKILDCTVEKQSVFKLHWTIMIETGWIGHFAFFLVDRNRNTFVYRLVWGNRIYRPGFFNRGGWIAPWMKINSISISISFIIVGYAGDYRYYPLTWLLSNNKQKETKYACRAIHIDLLKIWNKLVQSWDRDLHCLS